MIKYLQKLKAKKGFTLVELIVVIAIIGVLAAILIPTMLNFVTQANVSSANTTAASMQDRVDEWLTKLNTKGEGMKLSNADIDLITVEITTASNTTTWTISGPTASTGATGHWNKAPAPSTGYAVPSGYATAATGSSLAFFEYMQPLFPDIREGTIVAYLQAGKCPALVFTPTTGNSGTITGIWTNATDATDTTKWVYNATNFQQEGVLTGGVLAGTSPAIRQ